MKKKKKLETKKKWETPVVRTLPFKNTLQGGKQYTYEDAFYS